LPSDLIHFVVDRLKVHLRDQGVRPDLIAAAFSQVGGPESDLVRLRARVAALQRFLSWDDGANLLIAYRRASNIVVIEERKDGRAYDGPVNRALFRLPEEEMLNSRLEELSRLPRTTFWEREEFERVMTALASLRHPVDAFFDKVTVNTDEPKLRENRLRLLSRIRSTMNQVANFSQIEG
jgi:glycyl-tRNA synthetase beta chain